MSDSSSSFSSLDELKCHLKEAHGVGSEDLASVLLGVADAAAAAAAASASDTGQKGDKVVREETN